MNMLFLVYFQILNIYDTIGYVLNWPTSSTDIPIQEVQLRILTGTVYTEQRCLAFCSMFTFGFKCGFFSIHINISIENIMAVAYHYI